MFDLLRCCPPIERLVPHPAKSLLPRMMVTDHTSQELACFGHHVLAQKRG